MRSSKLKAASRELPKSAETWARRTASSAHRLKLTAFTLLEVVVAIGIFAVGMVAVIGLFSPVAKSVGDSADAEAATRVADLLNVKLQADETADALAGAAFKSLAARMKVATGKTHQLTDADAKSNYNPGADAQILFANREGTKIGRYIDNTVWAPDSATGRPSDREKYFEIALIRNETISPVGSDAGAAMLAYTARVRWPSFVALAGTGSAQIGANPTSTVPFDHSQKQVLFFSGAITR